MTIIKFELMEQDPLPLSSDFWMKQTTKPPVKLSKTIEIIPVWILKHKTSTKGKTIQQHYTPTGKKYPSVNIDQMQPCKIYQSR